MTDHRPICQIPPDARIGDIVVFRDGQRKKIEGGFDGYNWPVEGSAPGYSETSGNGRCGVKLWEVVAFEYADGRKPNLPHAGKPKRTQAQMDAKYIRRHSTTWLNYRMTKAEIKRMLEIADRMEEKQS